MSPLDSSRTSAAQLAETKEDAYAPIFRPFARPQFATCAEERQHRRRLAGALRIFAALGFSEDAYYPRRKSMVCSFLAIAALVAVFVLGVVPADMYGARSPSEPLARIGDPFIAGHTEEHPAVPGPYAELPKRHYLAARDPITGADLTAPEPSAPVVASAPQHAAAAVRSKPQ
jgi:hypothetical protein